MQHSAGSLQFRRQIAPNTTGLGADLSKDEVASHRQHENQTQTASSAAEAPSNVDTTVMKVLTSQPHAGASLKFDGRKQRRSPFELVAPLLDWRRHPVQAAYVALQTLVPLIIGLSLLALCTRYEVYCATHNIDFLSVSTYTEPQTAASDHAASALLGKVSRHHATT